MSKRPSSRTGQGSPTGVAGSVSTAEHPPVQNLIAPARNVAFGIVASSDELVGKGLQSGDLLLLRASKGVRTRWAMRHRLVQAAGLTQRVVILGD